MIAFIDGKTAVFSSLQLVNLFWHNQLPFLCFTGYLCQSCFLLELCGFKLCLRECQRILDLSKLIFITTVFAKNQRHKQILG